MRCLLVSNGLVLAAIGALYVTARQYVVAGVLGGAALGLWALVPLTDPYRRG
jgi:hypothetical protein